MNKPSSQASKSSLSSSSYATEHAKLLPEASVIQQMSTKEDSYLEFLMKKQVERDGVFLDGLYGQSDLRGRYAVQAVFQSLRHPLSKSFIMKTIFSKVPFSFEEVTDSHIRHADWMEMKEELLRFRILDRSGTRNSNSNVHSNSNSSFSNSNSNSNSISRSGNNKIVDLIDEKYVYNENFEKCLLATLHDPQRPFASTEDGDSNRGSMSMGVSLISESDIETQAKSKWESALRFLLGINKKTSDVSEELKKIFSEKLKLLVSGGLTSKGYEFMLLDYKSQLWKVICNFLNDEKNADNLIDNVNLLSALSYSRACTLYDIETIKQYLGVNLESESTGSRSKSLKFLQFLIQIGVIMGVSSPDSGGKIRHIILTNVATNIIFMDDMASTATQSKTSRANDAFIDGMKLIVETNRQVVAYISNDLHIAMLNLFVDIFVRLPNMVFGELKRSKIIDSFYRGITVKQILSFLETNSHLVVDPTGGFSDIDASSSSYSNSSGGGGSSSRFNNNNSKCSKGGNSDVSLSRVPFNIREQLQLWFDEEMQLNDIKDAELITLDESTFMSAFEIDNAKSEYNSAGVIIWESSDKNCRNFIVKPYE